MALPVIEDVFRVSFDYGGADGVTPANVIHVRGALSDEAEVAAIMEDHMTSDMLSGMSNRMGVVGVTVLKLDGTSAGLHRVFTAVPAGNQATGFSPASAAVVSLYTGTRGPRGRGRVFIGPICEGVIDSGILAGGVVTDLTDAWQQFSDDINSGTDPVQLVVASYKHADAHDVTSIACKSLLGTQRRRQDQLR